MTQKNEREKKFELRISKIENSIELLKIKYNLYFSGEINVPPEQEREALEKVVRNILSDELKSAKISLLIQNVTSRFNIYNNMWKKKLNQLESGELKRSNQKRSFVMMNSTTSENSEVSVSLNDENSFENFYKKYSSFKKGKTNIKNKDSLINSIKVKLISKNLVDAKIELTKFEGKTKIKIKK